MKNLTEKKVYHLLAKEILTVVEDYENGELLFSNGVLGLDDDIVVMEETTQYIQENQTLIHEFDDLIKSDDSFNYKEDEFVDWFFTEVYELTPRDIQAIKIYENL